MPRDNLESIIALTKTNWDMATQLLGDLAVKGIAPERGSAQIQQMRNNTSPESVAARLSDAYASTDVTDLLAGIKIPVLIIQRADDTLFPFRVAQEMAAVMPSARLIALSGDGPISSGDDVATIMQAIVDFLDEDRIAAPSAPQIEHPGAFRTVLFTDLVGHTEMMRRLGDAKGRDVLREHERITRDLLKQHGGAEVKTMGDGFMASFGSVTSAMDCAIALQRAFAAHEGEPLQVRVGLNAGEPIEEDGDLFGSTVILASRIAAKAGAGEILIPEPLRHLLTGKSYVYADRGETMLKGFEDAVRLYEVHWREGA